MSTAPLASDTFLFDHSLAVINHDRSYAYRYGDTGQVYVFASVTKPLTAWATLIAVQEGYVDMDDVVLKNGATVSHILAHCSGLPVEKEGDSIAPETRRIYSNYGYEVIGQYVEQATGKSFSDWARLVLLDPLHMVSTRIDGSPARSGAGTVADLVRFLREIMRPQLLDPALARYATTPQYDGLRGILPGFGMQKNNQWGLGLEIKDGKTPHWLAKEFSPRTFGHFGMSGSFIWVDPDVGKAGVFLGAKQFNREHIHVWPSLTREMREQTGTLAR